MQSMAVGSLVSLVNPVKNGRLDIGSFTKILNANSSVYNDEWAIEAKNVLKSIMVCPEGYLTDATGLCYKDITVPGNPIYPNTVVTAQARDIYNTCGTYVSSLSSSYMSVTNTEAPDRITLHTDYTWQNGTNACNRSNKGKYYGPLNRCGIWLPARTNGRTANYRNEWVGVKTKIYLASDKITNKTTNGLSAKLFIGFGSQHNIEVRIDNVIVAAFGDRSVAGNAITYRYWRIKPVNITLNQQHEIFIRLQNRAPAAMGVVGVELYDNTKAQLQAAKCVATNCSACTPGGSDNTSFVCHPGVPASNVVWSTDCLKLYNYFNYHALANGRDLGDFAATCSNGVTPAESGCYLTCNVIQRVYANKIPKSTCALPVGQTINPYTAGLRGNWRMQQSFVYHTDREATLPYIKPGDPDVIEKTDVRKSGTYAIFSPFWKYEGNQWLSQEQQPVKDVNWVKANEMTVFNQKGQEIENVDALNRYSAAQFGYLQSMATAVASNARYTDIGYDGFEDYDFDVDNCNNADTCNQDGHFSIRRLSRKYPSAIIPDATYAHTGRNSLRVTGAVNAVITKKIIPATSAGMYTFSGAAMQLTDKGILYGFKPQRSKNYLLSAWIKDEPPASPAAGLDESTTVQLGPNETTKAAVEVISGGAIIAATVKAGPRVEKWRKVEVIFTVPANASDIQIMFRPGSSTAYFDDIRIQPFDAQMKTYAYDNKSMRLWAELDENNFATFYEYDDEGILIRVKKETERGIMTIKETRSTYRFKK
jgi:hypothetical protein